MLVIKQKYGQAIPMLKRLYEDIYYMENQKDRKINRQKDMGVGKKYKDDII